MVLHVVATCGGHRQQPQTAALYLFYQYASVLAHWAHVTGVKESGEAVVNVNL